MDAAAAVRSMLADVADWWRLQFPPAIVIFCIFIGLGKMLGWLVTKVMMMNVRKGIPPSMLHIREQELEGLKAAGIKRGINHSGIPTKVYSGAPVGGWPDPPNDIQVAAISDKVGDDSTTAAAWWIRWVWHGSYSQDGALVGGHVARILSYMVGAVVALGWAGLSLAPLIAAAGLGAFAVSIALRDVLSGFFAGIVLMMYDVVRAGDIIQFGPASGGPSVEGQYRVLHINLKHSIVVPLDETSKIGPESSNGLWFVPNSVMLNVGGDFVNTRTAPANTPSPDAACCTRAYVAEGGGRGGRDCVDGRHLVAEAGRPIVEILIQKDIPFPTTPFPPLQSTQNGFLVYL